MSPIKRILLYFLLPLIAVLSYPPALFQISNLSKNGLLFGLVILLFVFLTVFLWTGRSVFLTLSIFIQGMNVVIRLMMFFPNAFNKTGGVNYAFAITCLLGLVISFYLMLRLDRTDVRTMMVK